MTDDGGLVLGGEASRYYRDATSEYIKSIALLAKIDKYGNVEWCRTYLANRGIPDLSFSKIYKTSDGDIIAYMAIDNGPSLFVTDFSFNRVMRLSPKGEVKWSTNLSTGKYDAGGKGISLRRAITQTANKNIVVVDAVYQTERGTGNFKMSDGRLHIFSLDYTTGKVSWESDHSYEIPVSDPQFVPNIESVNEMSDGRLCFATSIYVHSNAQSPLVKKPVCIITNNKGSVQKIVSYASASGGPLKLIRSIQNTPGKYDLLMQDGNKSVIASIGSDGSVTKSKGYAMSFPVNSFALSSRGYAMIFSDSRAKNFNLLLSDPDLDTTCTQMVATIASENITVENNPAVSTIIDVALPSNFKNYFVDAAYPLKRQEDYSMERTITCEEQMTCCVDMVDSLHSKSVDLCEGRTFTLPDNSVVRDSGTYYVSYRTTRGCDSILFFRININKSLKEFTIGEDTCMLNQSSALLRVTPGYKNYTWMGTSTVSDTFRVYSTGLYWAKVSNACGTKIDSVTIYDQCEFPVYIPGAFTPNGDGLNDYFGVPEQNKNRLIELKIYNRWGQIVFETKNKSDKWDGKYKNIPQANGLFIYNLVMEDLSGKKRITHKGTVLLLR
jgi:gliding motility-associated-like protein